MLSFYIKCEIKYKKRYRSNNYSICVLFYGDSEKYIVGKKDRDLERKVLTSFDGGSRR